MQQLLCTTIIIYNNYYIQQLLYTTIIICKLWIQKYTLQYLEHMKYIMEYIKYKPITPACHSSLCTWNT